MRTPFLLPCEKANGVREGLLCHVSALMRMGEKAILLCAGGCGFFTLLCALPCLHARG
ncbi:o-antigen ligase [Acetobacter orientalis]|uniref:O-antigen ligase n=1 Tax=Acetobacter orientalis TaxID=146474 RepID=A0A2Z5ZGQ5_9PROT|nr:o-antigen ligase [Acetobacter orientalis]